MSTEHPRHNLVDEFTNPVRFSLVAGAARGGGSRPADTVLQGCAAAAGIAPDACTSGGRCDPLRWPAGPVDVTSRTHR